LTIRGPDGGWVNSQVLRANGGFAVGATMMKPALAQARKFRIHIDPAQDGVEIVNGVADRVCAEFLRNMGLADLLKTKVYRA